MFAEAANVHWWKGSRAERLFELLIILLPVTCLITASCAPE